MKHRIIHISDIHLGHKHATELSMDVLISSLALNYNEHTIVVFTGDLFHHKVNLDSESARLGLKLLTFLNGLGIPSVFINGTRSHDYNYQDSVTRDIFPLTRFVNTVEEIYIDGLDILCVPEEYMDDQHEYYSNTVYGKDKYDLILFHGTISDIASYNSMIEDVPYKKAPLFKKSDFMSRTNLTCCGHIHKPQEYTEGESLLCYAGSWNRLVHGEEEPKGMFIYELDKDGDNIATISSHKFIENTSATKLIDYRLTEGKSADMVIVNGKEMSVNDFTEYIAEQQSAKAFSRLILDNPSPSLYNITRGLERRFNSVSILDKTNKDNSYESRNSSNIELIKEIDSCESIEDELHMFITKVLKLDISKDRIRMLLTTTSS